MDPILSDATIEEELKIALDLLGKAQEFTTMQDDWHDDVAAAASHFGWWTDSDTIKFPGLETGA